MFDVVQYAERAMRFFLNPTEAECERQMERRDKVLSCWP